MLHAERIFKLSVFLQDKRGMQSVKNGFWMSFSCIYYALVLYSFLNWILWEDNRKDRWSIKIGLDSMTKASVPHSTDTKSALLQC